MQSIMQLLFAGIANGCIYALTGISLVLLYNAVGIVNLAQSSFVALGGYIVLTFLNSMGFGVVASLLLSCVPMALIGFVFEKAVYRPLQKRGWLFIMISTIGVTMVLKELSRIIWGAQPLTMKPLFSVFSVDIFGLKINPQYILIIVLTAVLLILQYIMFEKTTLGKKLTATAEDPDMAQLMGIATKRMVTITFMYSMILAALAGFLLIPLNYATTTMADTPALKAFVAAVIGGFGSIPGVICGGLFVGIVENFSSMYISSGMKDAVAFILLIIALIIRPQGFFGEKSSRRV